jgi:anti-anti-sigma regulatory factor
VIAEAKDDVLVLSGSLTENFWETIRTAATLMLKRHPQGIVIDCSLIDEVTEAGSKTFIDALKYIESRNARIIVANVPPHVKDKLQQVLNVRSRLPFADSMEAARASLNLSDADLPNISRTADIVLFPVGISWGDQYAASTRSAQQKALILSARFAQQLKAELHLVYFMEIPRALPVGTPLPGQEAEAIAIFEEAERLFKKQNIPIFRHIERVRDWPEALVKMVEEMKVETLVLSLPPAAPSPNEAQERILKILRKVRCEVILYRKSIEEAPADNQAPR